MARKPDNVAEPFASEGAEPDVGEIAGQDTGALLPAQLLQPGELIILMIKPSPLYILLAPLRTLAIIVVLALIIDQLTRFGAMHISRQDIVLATVILVGLRLFWQFLEWVSRVYVLTDRRIIRVKGVVRVEVFEAALKQVQHTEAIFTLRERLFGLGSISFATAGTAIPEAFWHMLAKPLDVHQTVVRTLERYR